MRWRCPSSSPEHGPSIGTTHKRLGIGRRTGIPLQAEPEGFMPTEEWSQEKLGHRILPGNLANIGYRNSARGSQRHKPVCDRQHHLSR